MDTLAHIGRIHPVPLTSYCFLLRRSYICAIDCLACSTALIVVWASHFTNSNRLHRRIKMQSLDIDHKESTPLAKLTRQCIWINTAFPSLGKRFPFPRSPPSAPPVIQAKVLICTHFFQSISLKLIMEYQL